MEPGSKQDGEVVNMTRAMEALSPLLKHPRKTIVKVEALVIVATGLLLVQLALGFCKRRWHKSWVKYLLQVPSKLMNPLIIYTLGTMQSSPIKNSLYPVWAVFLMMASMGTTAVQQYAFCDTFISKYMEGFFEFIRYGFYAIMFNLLLDPNHYTLKTAFVPWHLKHPRASSNIVSALFDFVLLTKGFEPVLLAALGYNRRSPFIPKKKISHKQVAEMRTEETAIDQASDSHHQSMKGFKYHVCYRPVWGFGRPSITIDQIWDCCDNTAYGKALKDLCLSCALSWRLVQQRYFGEVFHETSLQDHDFVFKKLLPSEGDSKRAFRIIEVELGFCYDFFFTKYYYNFFFWMISPLPFIQCLILGRIVLILTVGVLTIRKSLVLETPNPIIEVHISEDDYMITLLLLGIALTVELVQAVSYLASNWAQVSLACMYVKKHWYEPNAFIFGEVIAFLRRVVFFGQLMMKNKIDQHSVISRQKQLDPIEVSDAVKRAVARLLISTYGTNLTTTGETSLWQNQMFVRYSWALKAKGLISHLEVMLIWHIATEYCEISNPTPCRTTRCRCSKHRGFADHLFGYVLQLFPNLRRNRITHLDIHRGTAVHLSRYCAYLIGYVPELLPYHKADIAALEEKVMEERRELFGSYRNSMIYSKMKNLEGTEEEDEPRKIFQKGVKLGKQLNRLPDGDRWEVLEEFWAETIIHAAKSHYTTKQHMELLEDGGEFLTHIWALLAHAGILNLNWDKDQEGEA